MFLCMIIFSFFLPNHNLFKNNLDFKNWTHKTTFDNKKASWRFPAVKPIVTICLGFWWQQALISTPGWTFSWKDSKPKKSFRIPRYQQEVKDDWLLQNTYIHLSLSRYVAEKSSLESSGDKLVTVGFQGWLALAVLQPLRFAHLKRETKCWHL